MSATPVNLEPVNLEDVRDILTDAVLAGAARVLDVRRSGAVNASYKDATEMVTNADKQSDAAMLAIFRERLALVDPEMSLHLEESGLSGGHSARRIGADPLDGTNHFAAGGNLYSVQAHYIDAGVPLVGVVFQPEVFLPLAESARCLGRLVSAIRGHGAFSYRTEWVDTTFVLGEARPVTRRPSPTTRTFAACVPFTLKMAPDERKLAENVHQAGIISASTGTGNAGGNTMMVIFGGHELYANFGAGEDLDLVPAQVIAEEVGLTVWGPDRRPPVWHVRKQPFIVAPDPAIAERVLSAAGL